MQNVAMRPASKHRAEILRTVAAVAFAVCVMAGFTWNVLAAAGPTISQKERTFQPHVLQIARGETVHILNDDGELLHHAYVTTDAFSFDSGEQEPASVTNIRFTAAGTYTVRCRIHPKMSLVVVVQ
jgi:plastocyanin